MLHLIIISRSRLLIIFVFALVNYIGGEDEGEYYFVPSKGCNFGKDILYKGGIQYRNKPAGDFTMTGS